MDFKLAILDPKLAIYITSTWPILVPNLVIFIPNWPFSKKLVIFHPSSAILVTILAILDTKFTIFDPTLIIFHPYLTMLDPWTTIFDPMLAYFYPPIGLKCWCLNPKWSFLTSNWPSMTLSWPFSTPIIDPYLKIFDSKMPISGPTLIIILFQIDHIWLKTRNYWPKILYPK